MCGGPENTEPGKNLMSVFISSFEVLVMQRKMNIKHKSVALLISSMLKEKQSSMGQHFSKCLAKKAFRESTILDNLIFSLRAAIFANEASRKGHVPTTTTTKLLHNLFFPLGVSVAPREIEDND